MSTKKTVDKYKNKSCVVRKSKINPDAYTKNELVELVLKNKNIDVRKSMANKLTKAELCYILSEADKKMIKVKSPSNDKKVKPQTKKTLFNKVGFDTELVADNILKNIRRVSELKNIVDSGIGGPVFKQLAKEKLKEVKEATLRLRKITRDRDRISVNKREVKNLISKADLSNTLLHELVKYSLVHHETDMFKILLKNGARNLKVLNLSYCRGFSDISPLKNFVNLTYLNLWGTEISDISPLKDLKNLENLNLGGTNVSDISPLKNLKNIKYLYLSDCRGLSDISSLKDPEGPVNLKFLDLRDCHGLSDISPLKNLKNLKYLDLRDCHGLSDISPLSNIKNLKNLSLNRTNVSDISPLKNLKNLEKLNLSYCRGLSDISPLGNLEKLEELYLQGTNVTDISPLEDLKNLETLL